MLGVCAKGIKDVVNVSESEWKGADVRVKVMFQSQSNVSECKDFVRLKRCLA